MKGSLFRQWAQKEVCSLKYVTDWYVPMISRKGRLTLILLLAKGLYQMKTQEEMGPAGLGDVRIKVFIDGDVA